MNKYAVIIGINQYHTSLGSLRYCCNDAELIKDVLLSKECGFLSDNILLLTDRQKKDRQPTFGNIHSWLGNWLTLPEADDMLIFYFAGHGFYKNGTTLLVPSDANMQSLDITGIRLSYVQDLIENCKARQKILFLDACHSGSGRDVMPMAREFSQELESAEGIYTIASCKEDQISHECEDKEHGVFTWSLVDAIQNADANSEGHVTLDSVFQRCRQNIMSWCKTRCLTQTPLRISRTTDDIVFLCRNNSAISDVGTINNSNSDGHISQQDLFRHEKVKEKRSNINQVDNQDYSQHTTINIESNHGLVSLNNNPTAYNQSEIYLSKAKQAIEYAEWKVVIENAKRLLSILPDSSIASLLLCIGNLGEHQIHKIPNGIAKNVFLRLQKLVKSEWSNLAKLLMNYLKNNYYDVNFRKLPLEISDGELFVLNDQLSTEEINLFKLIEFLKENKL